MNESQTNSKLFYATASHLSWAGVPDYTVHSATEQSGVVSARTESGAPALGSLSGRLGKSLLLCFLSAHFSHVCNNSPTETCEG